MAVELARVARKLGNHCVSQVARLLDPIFAMERAQSKRKVEDEVEQQRLTPIAELTFPTEW